ncbi:MAG TPA: hypothetical protein VGN86_02070 [Pyrinomonadaceae bacterium]|jgi:hypothetical protein|nr:hypothetical protein [Pyrinomonadaceae bacterium]
MSLRVRGIYCLPNGSELIVLSRHQNGHVTYRLGGWQRFELTEYEVNDQGRLTYHGKLTAWDVANLKDTGQTAMAHSHPLDIAVESEP